ncbi:MAG: hypothetical protein LC687_07190 [Actinobacteria bacterium]|nr:hypothetical protein [Actinomycetota bacterium]
MMTAAIRKEEKSKSNIEEIRDCSRCDGNQYLVADSALGMGKYRCENCCMIVGFDLEAEPKEFLLDRGIPYQYTKNIFGTHLMKNEIRSVKEN